MDRRICGIDGFDLIPHFERLVEAALGQMLDADTQLDAQRQGVEQGGPIQRQSTLGCAPLDTQQLGVVFVGGGQILVQADGRAELAFGCAPVPFGIKPVE